MLESIKTKINDLNKSGKTIVANKLIESLREVDCVLEDQTKNMNETPFLNERCGQKLLMDRPESLYKSVVYSKYSKTIENNSKIMKAISYLYNEEDEIIEDDFDDYVEQLVNKTKKIPEDKEEKHH